MSYKDLEAEIKAWANLEAYAKKQKEDTEEARRKAKRDKRAKKQGKGVLVAKRPAPTLAKPIKTFKDVTLEVRPIHHRKWGDIEQVTYTVETMSDTVAEVEAIKQARLDGYSFDCVVTIKTTEE
jgi:hypothetical protein